MIKTIEELIDSQDLSKEEREHLYNYAESLLKISIDFENQLSNLKNNVEFSKAIIDIIKQLSEDVKNVKRDT